jgi:DNA-binding NarL/FixJ family response regulator
MTIRVFLADDHAMFREGIKSLLASTPDIRVIAEVGDGGEAVRRIQDLQPDVALMDVSMPEVNGIEAARILHGKCPATRVVILSMHSSSEHVFRAFAAGAAGYLLKESAGAELVAAVRAVHGGRRYVSGAIAAQQAAVQAAVGRGAGPLESLSGRERQVLQLVVEGHSSAEIARRVHLSPKSVDTYRSRLMKKLGVGDVPALVKFAIQHGITPPG